MDDDGHEDNGEGQRHQQGTVLKAHLLKLGCEQACNGHGDDTARRDPGDKRTLLPRQRCTNRAEDHGGGADQKQHGADEGRVTPVQSRDGVPRQRCRQNDEHAGDKRGTYVLLEPAEFVQAGDTGVADGHSQRSDGQQACLVVDQIGDGETQQDGAKHQWCLQEFRDVSAMKCVDAADACGNAQAQRHRYAQKQAAGDHDQWLVQHPMDGDFVCQHGEQGADGVVDDALPPQHGGGAIAQPGLAEHGCDDGGARNDE